MQVLTRSWPASAVHDTVHAIVQQTAFRRSAQSTLLERFLGWLRQGWMWLIEQVGGLPSTRTILLWTAGLIALVVLARILIAAAVRNPESRAARREKREGRREDPWRHADACEAAGDYEGAAHALYRGVLLSLSQRERIRLDPSRTSGDYARELRARGSGLRDPFRTFARRFDYAVYGRGHCDATLVHELRVLAEPLRARERAA